MYIYIFQTDKKLNKIKRKILKLLKLKIVGGN